MLTARRQRGLTLIEFMVGLLIAGILTALAVPSFRTWIQNAQVRTGAESIVNGLQLARSEAVHLNTYVRFNLTSTSGIADWEICAPAPGVPAASPCPPGATVIQRGFGADGATNARIGVYKVLDGQPQTNFSLAIAAGNEMPAHVTFNGMGQTVNDGTDDAARIDVTSAALPTARRLVVLIDNPGGGVRMCDPALSATNPTDPQAC
jgi:type IV fimbrial biogenesis protein FimT